MKKAYPRIETHSKIIPYVIRDHAWNFDHHDKTNYYRYKDDTPEGYNDQDYEDPHPTNKPRPPKVVVDEETQEVDDPAGGNSTNSTGNLTCPCVCNGTNGTKGTNDTNGTVNGTNGTMGHCNVSKDATGNITATTNCTCGNGTNATNATDAKKDAAAGAKTQIDVTNADQAKIPPIPPIAVDKLSKTEKPKENKVEDKN